MSSSSSNSNDAKRDAQEGTNRLSEDLEHGMNKVKRAFVGGTGTSDTASETAHHASNRAGEIANRVVRHTTTTTPHSTPQHYTVPLDCSVFLAAVHCSVGA